MKSRSIKRTLVIVLVVIAGLYLAACIMLYFAQRSMLYFPTSRADSFPSISIESEGEKIQVLTKISDSTEAIVLFGGNADDVSNYHGDFANTFPKKDIFLVNYRGYGGSTGTPTESALFADALAVYDHVHERYQNITVIGRSLGTGVAVYLASVRNVDRLILITPYDSIENVAQSHFPIFPVRILLKDKFDSASRVKSLSARTLVLVAEHDKTIPRGHTDALVREFPPEQVVVKTLVGKTHDSITSGPDYLQHCREFLNN